LAQPRWEERVPPLSGRDFLGILEGRGAPSPHGRRSSVTTPSGDAPSSLHRHLPQRAHAWHARVFQQSPKAERIQRCESW
jgi:hypothetical protein